MNFYEEILREEKAIDDGENQRKKKPKLELLDKVVDEEQIKIEASTTIKNIEQDNIIDSQVINSKPVIEHSLETSLVTLQRHLLAEKYNIITCDN